MCETIINTGSYNLAVKLDNENNQLLAYDNKDDLVNKHSEGILTTVSSELALKIEQQLNISLSKYGVNIFDENISMEDIDYA